MKHLLTTFFVFCVLAGCAQKHDYTWLTGYDSEVGYGINFNYWFGISKFEFLQNPIAISYDSLGINFEGANCALSDSEGNLQFYTNGITVRNSHDETIGG